MPGSGRNSNKKKYKNVLMWEWDLLINNTYSSTVNSSNKKGSQVYGFGNGRVRSVKSWTENTHFPDNTSFVGFQVQSSAIFTFTFTTLNQSVSVAMSGCVRDEGER